MLQPLLLLCFINQTVHVAHLSYSCSCSAEVPGPSTRMLSEYCKCLCSSGLSTSYSAYLQQQQARIAVHGCWHLAAMLTWTVLEYNCC